MAPKFGSNEGLIQFTIVLMRNDLFSSTLFQVVVFRHCKNNGVHTDQNTLKNHVMINDEFTRAVIKYLSSKNLFGKR